MTLNRIDMSNSAPEAPATPAPRKLQRIDGGTLSSKLTQAHTFSPENARTLSAVERAGVTQVCGGNQISVTATTQRTFSEHPHITDASGRVVADVGKAQDSHAVMIGDLQMSLGAARAQGLVKNQNGEIVLTPEGRELMQARAGKMLNKMEAADVYESIHNPQHAKAMELLNYQTKGKMSSYLPQIMADHVAGKPMNYEAVRSISDATGKDANFIQGLLSEIIEASVDNACRRVGQAEGLAGPDVFQMVNQASELTKRRFLTACAMGNGKECRDIVKALRNRSIK